MQVIEGSAADRAGLQRGDLLMELDGEPIADATDLQRLMVQERIGRKVEARILREGTQMTIAVVLDELA
jgi:S1-C subfamily serine protease